MSWCSDAARLLNPFEDRIQEWFPFSGLGLAHFHAVCLEVLCVLGVTKLVLHTCNELIRFVSTHDALSWTTVPREEKLQTFRIAYFRLSLSQLKSCSGPLHDTTGQ